MNRQDFMKQLARLLSDIPPREREEALNYYESYFDEAGLENEASVIRELGSPGRVAAEIKAGFHADPEAGEYTDTGYRNDNIPEEDKEKNDVERYNGRRQRRKNGDNKGNKLILFIIIAILTAPIWFGALGVLFSLLMGLFGIILGLLAGTLFGGIGLIIGSVVLIVVGLIKLVGSFGIGLVVLGLGMIFLAIGMLLICGFGWLISKAIPALIRFVVDLFHRIFRKTRREEAE